MKRILHIALGSLLALPAFSAVLIVEGKFQSKNIYVQNSFGGVGVGFCATEVKVNGKITTDEVNSSAFEIDLMACNIKPGEKVTIEIVHKDDCTPRVLNPEVLKSRPTFDIVNISINASNVLKWTSKNESGSLPYIVEQFKWNKWVYVGEVPGDGTPGEHNYSFKVTTHSGENKFRVKQSGLGTLPRTSNAVILNSTTEKPNYMITKDGNSIEYSYETAYEVYDVYGTIVKKGFGKELNIQNLPKGKYYLCYDNHMTEIEKKKS